MALFDAALIRKYDRPGPRYTSYPTAPQLHAGFDSAAFHEQLSRSNAQRRPLSLYVHIPFCPSLCLYCACNVSITRRQDRICAYLDQLEAEMARISATVDSARRVTQLHWGGGTPSYLTPAQILELGGHLRRHFAFDADLEAGVEIDPRGVTRAHLEAFREVGFNRVSLGVQDVDLAVQEAIHRIQPLEITAEVVGWCRELGFESLNLDLVYGLPHQRVQTYQQTLDAVLGLAPDRLAVFSYAHVPWMKPHQRAIDDCALPSSEEKLSILELVVRRLTEAGYLYIGMDHFARPDDQLARAQAEGTLWRNFQGYTTRSGADLIGLGVTSLGLFEGAYYQNERNLKAYHARLAAGDVPIMRGLVLSGEDRLRRQVIMALMCQFEVVAAAIEQAETIDFWGHFAAERAALDPLEQDGLVECDETGVRITERGRLLVRNVAMVFDAYLGAGPARFSKTV